MEPDDICTCGHVFDEHDRTGCLVPNCDCAHFDFHHEWNDAANDRLEEDS